MTTHLRTMNPGDYAALHRLWLQTPGLGLNTTDDSEEGIRGYLARNPATSFVAVVGEVVVGAILAGHDGRRGYIYHLVVSAIYQGQGIGGHLVDSALSALRGEGITKVALLVLNSNSSAQEFWAARGFGERTDVTYRDCGLCELEVVLT